MSKLNPVRPESDVDAVGGVFDELTDEMKSLVCSIAFSNAANEAHLAPSDMKIWLREGDSPENFYRKHIADTNLKMIKFRESSNTVFIADKTSSRWDHDEIVP